MKEQTKSADETSVSSSGLQWTILAAVIGLILLFAFGAFRKTK
jgi:hypothetical protein